MGIVTLKVHVRLNTWQKIDDDGAKYNYLAKYSNKDFYFAKNTSNVYWERISCAQIGEQCKWCRPSSNVLGLSE